MAISFLRIFYEAHVSTKSSKTGSPTRVSFPNADENRHPCGARTTPNREKTPDSLGVCMLSQKHRLRKREDFAQVFRFGKPNFFDGVAIFARTVPNSPLRIGVAFKQKMFPRATNRNSYKRRVLSALFPLIAALPENKDVVILFQKPEKRASYAYFVHIAESLLKILNSPNKNTL